MAASTRRTAVAHGSLAAWLILLAIVWLTVVGFALWKRTGIFTHSSVITSVLDRPTIKADGTACRIQIGRNEMHAVRVILIRQHTLPSTLWPTSLSSPTGSATRPATAAALKSQAVLVGEQPPDPVRSGLWINGVKHPLKERLTVVYVSDVVPATEVHIPAELQDAFIYDAENSEDEFACVTKWIMPRLAAQGAAQPMKR
jgi:hypothetical protein